MTPSSALISSGAPLSTDRGLAHHVAGWLARHKDDLIGFRRELHAFPGLSGAEHATAALVAQQLTRVGLSPRFLPGGNGVICEFGSSGPLIAMRADLDAIPLSDAKDVPYRSTVSGVCHACGHDVHTTVVLGAGLVLAALGDALPGRVRLLFQPSEEKAPFGSLDVIAAGGLEGVDEIYSLHCDPKVPTGQVGLRVGPVTAACDLITVRVSGAGGHTARPHLTAHLVGGLSRIISDVPSLLARKFDNRSGLLVTFGAVHAGTAQNIIPSSGYALGTVRVLDSAAWEQVPEAFIQTVAEIAAPTGVGVDVDYQRGVPPVDNTEHAVSILSGAAVKALGPDAVLPTQQSMGGEDFSWYLRQVPGAMVRLGVARDGVDVDIHQPDFDVDERSIGYGVSLFATTLVDAMRCGAEPHCDGR